ncbi:CCR4-Not complex component, Not1-domain-containing protein [Zychaea mexicana]|uniref:CCR4-Not complex component, Not1-domain-containing protein n=1 Tax=Zychaea mexicana TaxID=64656 RepID=UPI0022FE2549|nr:CCR4-Not complex component, Not1-domain-containing protein [Zychaea mexicana]KAI9496644.1 CCR4-Not complex component, Not1-domain-containing protein [Zychaea mexicana]
MLCAPIDLLDLANNPTTTNVIRPVHIMGLHVSVRPIAIRLAASQLNCVEIIGAILDLAETSTSDDVRVLLDRLTLQTPELLLLGLAQLQPIRSGLHRDLLIKLLSIFLIGHANTSLVISILWRVQPTLLLEGLLDMYKKDPTSVPRILDIAQEAKILVHILHADVPFFTLDLAALAARRQNLNLAKWLTERLSEDGAPFAVACIDFLEKKCTDEMVRHSQGGSNVASVHLSKGIVRIFFRVLSESPLPQQEGEKLWKIMQFYSQMLSQLDDDSPSEERSLPPGYGPDMNSDPSAEIEDMVRSYFERLYTAELSAEQFITVLHACHDSKDPKQVDFFSCTVHTLLDEARFFNQYPDHELAVTGKLFGLLIDRHLISFSLLRLALKHVLDALNHPLGTKMFNFGVLALAQFRNRLSEWPQYTMLLSKIAGLREYPPVMDSIATTLQHLASTANIDSEGRILNSPSVSERTNASSSATTIAAREQKQARQQQVDNNGISSPGMKQQAGSVLLEKASSSPNSNTYTPPPSDVQEKIAFAINNLSLSNLEDKVAQVDPLLEEPAWGWFSHYLVVRRVTQERNNHELYASLLKTLEKPPLCDMVVEETYKNIQILLHAEGTPASQTDRNALKALGSWLGRMTLAKNKPIRHKDLSFKDLLLDAYDRNKLILAIPLTCKVLQEAQESKIFKPPNPWLMRILKLLAELYWHEDLRLNLKFEIELLYKTLNLDLNEIEPTALLEERQQQQQQRLQKQQQQQQQQPGPPGLNGIEAEHEQPQILSQMSTSVPAPFQAKLDDIRDDDQRIWPGGIIKISQKDTIFSLVFTNDEEKPFNIDVSSLMTRLQFSPSVLHTFEQQPITKRIVFNAISESYKKVASPAIATAANIACTSARHLVLKDFATDSDEMKLKRAAHRMVGTLAGSLSVATCKEPLCNSIINTIRAQFSQIQLPEAAADEIGGSVILDNMDLMEAFVDQLGQMRAINEVDKVIAASYNSRRVHREQQIRAPYFDVLSFQGSPHNISLPEALRPNSSLDPEQMHVYDAFDQLPIHATEARAANFPDNGLVGNHPSRSPGESVTSPRHDNGAVAGGAGSSDVKSEALLAEMDRYVRQASSANVQKFKELPPDHDLYQFLRQLFMFLRDNGIPAQHMQTFTEKVALALYESNNLVTLEAYTVLLQIILELYPIIAKEVIGWLMYADDERKYNAQVTAMCMSYDLIPMEEYDIQLSRLIRAKADGVMDYAATLIRLCLLANNQDSVLEDHVLTVAALNQLVHDGEAPPSVLTVISDLRAQYEKPYMRVKSSGLDYLELRMMLAEWTRFCLHPLSSEAMLDSFASQILKKITASKEKQSAFLRLCIQTSIQQYLTFCTLPLPQQARMKESTDSVAKLVACMVSVQATKKGHPEAAAKLLTDALSVCVLLLAHCHEVQGREFDQRPFLRLFISSYIEVSKKAPALNPVVSFSEILYSIRPTVLPGFAFSWLQFISHRVLLSDLLAGSDPERWKLCRKLIVVLLDFLGMIVDEGGLGAQSAQLFYRSTLRTLVVLLHDFPEFLSHYYMEFVTVIPYSCVQIRNLILSAFPRTMRLPDPSAPDMELDGLPEYNENPDISTDYVKLLSRTTTDVDGDDSDADGDINSSGQTELIKSQAVRYLQGNDVAIRTEDDNMSFVDEALQFLKKDLSKSTDPDASVPYHADRMEALVLFLGVQTIEADSISYENIGSNPAVLVYIYLLEQMSPQGRYLLLNTIVDQLRYPNTHTYFFRTVVLHLFATQAEDVKENITRVLLERLIVNRPHPWGLLATFIELLSTPNFWQHNFIHAAPDFERLFDNVSRYLFL